MINIISYIIEKLKVNSKSKIGIPTDIELDINDAKSKFNKDEIKEFVMYAEELPIPPAKIKTGLQGNLVLLWNEKLEFSSWNGSYFGNFKISISIPERYHGCFKIVWEQGTKEHPYEYPMGTNGYLNKDGSLKLPDIKSVFNQINNVWKKKDFTNKLKKS